MYQLSEAIQTKLAALIQEKFGYTVLSWDNPNDSGFYRPQVHFEDGRESQNIAVWRYPNAAYVYIQDHAANKLESIHLNLENFSECTQEEAESKVDKTLIEKQKKEKQAKFIEKYKQAVSKSRKATAKDTLFARKKLKPTDTIFMVKDDVFVPFRQSTSGPVIGCQIRKTEGKPKVLSIPGSTTSRLFMFSILSF